MTWCSKPFLFIVLSFLLIRCQDAFKTVNESLKKSDSVEGIAVDSLYAFIKQNRHKNEPLATQADKLFLVIKDAHSYLENVKQRLEAYDSSRASTAIPEQLLAGTGTADTISQKLLTVYDHAHAALVDKTKNPSLDSAMMGFREMRGKQWSEKYFDNTPTIAAITMLSKFQYDCLDAAHICLGDVKQHLDNE